MSWNQGKVSDIGNVISGYAFKSEWFGTGHDKIIRIGDLQDGIVTSESAINFDNTIHKVSEQYIIKTGDILMALSGATVGKIAIASDSVEGSFLNQRVAIIRGKNVDSSNYLKYVFTGKFLQQLLMNAGGAAQPNLSPKDLASMAIPVPPIKEQKRIASILDKADAIRRKRQQAIKLADEFLRSSFLEMFGDPMMNSKEWLIRPLGQVAPPTPARGVTVSKDDNVWLLNLDNIESNTGRILAEYKCKYGDVGNSTHWFDQSHVLYSKLRPYLNKVVLPLSAGIATSELLPLKPNPAIINREYLAYFLRSDSFLKWADSKVAGAKMPRLSPSELQNLSIPIPPMDVQNHFRNIVNQVATFKSKFETFGILNGNLFNALSQKAFAGEL